MRKIRKLTVFLLVVTMILSSIVILPAASVKAEETATKDSWVDPGNYTRGWYDSVTDKDIYGNTGTKEDPYEIKSAKDLAGLAYYSNIAATDSATTNFGGKHIVITVSTIDLSEHYWYPIGAAQDFKGIVDGNNVTIQNMYIGSASEYETYGKVGLFGSIYADVKNIALENAEIYSNSTYTGGFVACWISGNIENCSVEGSIYHIASSSHVGGFIGSHYDNEATIKNGCANVTITCTSTSNNNAVGGFAGYNMYGTYVDCYATGNISALCSSSKVGGFIGNSEMGTQSQCFATGNVTAKDSCNAGGFIGAIRTNNCYNCYALGNVEAGINSTVAGFISWVWNYSGYSGYSTSMNIENCYAAGSTIAGAGSTVAGFFGARQHGHSTITFKKGYWNLSQSQVIDGTYRKDEEKIAVAYDLACRTAVGAYTDYMKSEEFAADLNEYVYQNSDQYNAWEVETGVNNGYPYISGNRAALITIAGDSAEVEVSNDGTATTSDMNVYGTLIFPEQESDQPVEEDMTISVGISWGSLEFVYTSGEYNEETETYADGIWASKEEGVTDKITVTNKSNEDVEIGYAFLASTEGTGNYANLTGTFYQEDKQTEITSTIPVRKVQGDIASIQNVFLKIGGVPVEQKTITTPEIIGTVLVTVQKHAETVTEPEEPAATEDTTVSEEPVVTEEAAASEAPVITEEPLETAVPETTEEVQTSEIPSTTESAVASEIPAATEEAVSSETPATTEMPVETEVPEATEEVQVSEASSTTESAVPSEVTVTAE